MVLPTLTIAVFRRFGQHELKILIQRGEFARIVFVRQVFELVEIIGPLCRPGGLDVDQVVETGPGHDLDIFFPVYAG